MSETLSSSGRRSFLQTLSGALLAVPPLASSAARAAEGCWLEVCAPLILEDPSRQLHSEIILTSDTFARAREAQEATDYELLLYDAEGRLIGAPRLLTVPSLHTTVIAARELIGEERPFFGGLKIRLRPRGSALAHASDLFSSAFVRWQAPQSFDNVHANPDPRQWQNNESYYYAMPFPSLAEYDCLLALFNPNAAPSAGEIALADHRGRQAGGRSYRLAPRASLLFHLNANEIVAGIPEVSPSTNARAGGQIAVTNGEGTAKSFGYLMIRARTGGRFSIEHPIHQSVAAPRAARVPFDASGKFKARNVLYSPLLFNDSRQGGVTLESRVHFGTGRPLEQSQWLYPFAVDASGEAVWAGERDARLGEQLAPEQRERGAIRIAAGGSCALDFARLSLPSGFAGGLGVAVAPDTTHTLLKLEVRVREWGAHAFTHFRPGLRSARLYQGAPGRGPLATDYIASGARLRRQDARIECDEVIGVLNIDDAGIEARPQLELHAPHGLLCRVALGALPPFACRHYLLSELMREWRDGEALTLRLIDERATLLMSVVHLDYRRRDLALDHGSDRFSTYQDFDCR